MTAPAADGLSGHFEAHRPHVRAVAYRMLGSISDADDAVQETWLRTNRSDVSDVQNMRGWLTTVTSRICLDMLRTRTSRREDPLDVHIPDPIVTRAITDDDDPEARALRTESLSLALMIVLDQLEPVERVAFVLHDVFGMPFDEIAPIIDRTPVATRKLASRARARVDSEAPKPDPDLRAQRRVVEAFLAAVQSGNFDALLGVLHPDIVLRADAGRAKGMSRMVRGAAEVASQAKAFSTMGLTSQIALINGNIGVVSTLPNGRVLSVIGYTVTDGKVAAMDILADAERIAGLDLSGVLGRDSSVE